MRYSRFKAAMLGTEPQRRNRTNPNRSRVSKKKKAEGSKSRNDDTAQAQDDAKAETGRSNIKQERAATEGAETPSSLFSPRVKEERMFMHGSSPLDPPSGSQPHRLGGGHLIGGSQAQAMSEMQSRLHMRLLTPCSDSDVLTSAASQGFGHHSPASEMLHPDATSFDFCHEPGPLQHHSHHHGGSDPAGSGQTPWHTHPGNQNVYPGFGLGLAMGYGGSAGGSNSGGLDSECYSAAFCDHQDHRHHTQHGIVVPDELGVHKALIDHESGQAMVKHEEWDTESYH
jgi:hypothetical protein